MLPLVVKRVLDLDMRVHCKLLVDVYIIIISICLCLGEWKKRNKCVTHVSFSSAQININHRKKINYIIACDENDKPATSSLFNQKGSVVFKGFESIGNILKDS